MKLKYVFKLNDTFVVIKSNDLKFVDKFCQAIEILKQIQDDDK